jgi:hypothetical protein
MVATVGPVPADDANRGEEKAVRDLETSEAKAVLSGDLAALERFWDESFTVNAPSNSIVDRNGVLTRVKAGAIKYAAFERKIEYIGFHGDMVVVMGQETVRPVSGPEAGKTIVRRYTNVWAMKGGRRVLVARQATNISVK